MLGNGVDVPALPISPTLRARLASVANDVTVYSTGDLTGIARVIAAHDALPLNQRQDRFGTVQMQWLNTEQRSRAVAEATAARTCSQ